MIKKVNYESPLINELEFVSEGVLCSSDREGGIDNLTPGNDWSDDLWNNN
jgi:hypothetical protein